MDRDVTIDTVQAEEYTFPYHYIPSRTSFPSFSKCWKFSPSYLAALNLVENWLHDVVKQASNDHNHIDIGCGDGALLNLLDTNRFGKLKRTGVDFDRRAIEWANMFSNGTEFVCKPVGEMPKGFYDSGSLIEVIEHIPPIELPKFISDVAKVLKDNAELFVTVPSTEMAVTKKHYQHFDFDKLKHAFENDFELLSIAGFEKYSLISKVLLRLCFGRRHYFEQRHLNNYFVRDLEKKYQRLDGCGRVMAIFRKRT